jgi:segregation and condensation protein B
MGDDAMVPGHHDRHEHRDRHEHERTHEADHERTHEDERSHEHAAEHQHAAEHGRAEGRQARRAPGDRVTTEEELGRAVEAVVMVAVEPVPPGLLAELLEEPVERVEAACERLAASYRDERRGFVLARVAGGYRFQTHPELAPYVERFANKDVSHRLSTAALETLAIVAYRQPVSRGQIASLRGVNADRSVRLLEQRGYIQAVGRADGPGQPVLYGTTDLFLERLGLDDVSQLPPVEDFLPGVEVVAELEAGLRPAGAPGAPGAPGTPGTAGAPCGPGSDTASIAGTDAKTD